MFTIVIAQPKEPDVLDRTLGGIAGQIDAPSHEVVIIAEPGQRDIWSTCQRWVDALDLRLVNEPNPGPGTTWCGAHNLALEAARSSWVVALDPECIPNPRYLAELGRRVREHPFSIVTGERVFVDADGVDGRALADACLDLDELPRVNSVSNYFLRRDRRFPALEHLADIHHPWSYFNGGNCAYPLSSAQDIGGYDEAYDGGSGYGDVDFAHRLIGAGGCAPRYFAGLEVFRQESRHARSSPLIHDRQHNPNWHRICGSIPGFRAHEERVYRGFERVVLVPRRGPGGSLRVSACSSPGRFSAGSSMSGP